MYSLVPSLPYLYVFFTLIFIVLLLFPSIFVSSCYISFSLLFFPILLPVQAHFAFRIWRSSYFSSNLANMELGNFFVCIWNQDGACVAGQSTIHCSHISCARGQHQPCISFVRWVVKHILHSVGSSNIKSCTQSLQLWSSRIQVTPRCSTDDVTILFPPPPLESVALRFILKYLLLIQQFTTFFYVMFFFWFSPFIPNSPAHF
jgi:hypothetical protein